MVGTTILGSGNSGGFIPLVTGGPMPLVGGGGIVVGIIGTWIGFISMTLLIKEYIYSSPSG